MEHPLTEKTFGSRRNVIALRQAAFVLVAVLFATAAPLRAATFTATLDRDMVTAGESATLTLSFEGGQPESIPDLPAIRNLQIGSQGTSRNFSVVNGQMTSSITATFELTPTQPGEYTIPALKAKVGGQTLTSQSLKLKAVKAGASVTDSSGAQLVFLKLAVPKKEVYLGEIVEVQLQLYIRDGVANAQNIYQWFESLGDSAFKADGFSAIKTAQAQPQRTQVGNSIYNLCTLVTALSPVKTGALTIDSINSTIPVQLPSANRRRDAFDPFGMFQQTEERRVAIAAETETLTVLPLPSEKMPADFTGAVGNYSLTVTAGPTNVAAGDPITVRVQIAGRGVFNSLTLPEQPAWHDFKVYPPTSTVTNTDPLGVQGAKIFEQIVVPQNSDVKAVPPFSFSFFDPDRKSYRTLTQPAIALAVRPSSSAPPPTVVASKGAAQDNPPPVQDIVSIKQHLGAVAQIGPPLVEQGWFLAFQGVPAIAFLSAAFWRKRSDMLANNPRRRRQRQVAQIIRDGLTALRKSAAENKPDEFFATLFRLLQEQLGERLDLPASAITEAIIEERLEPRNVPETTLTALHELFQTCNLARYAPIKTSQELAAIIPKLEAALHELQEMKI
jgi:hypothetical protein